MNTLTDLLLGVGQPRVSHFPDLCTLLYTYLSTLDYWTKIVYYLFTQTSPVAHTSALTPTYIKSQKLPNWPISKELGLGRMLLPHWKLLLYHGIHLHGVSIVGNSITTRRGPPQHTWRHRLSPGLVVRRHFHSLLAQGGVLTIFWVTGRLGPFDPPFSTYVEFWPLLLGSDVEYWPPLFQAL